MNDSDIRRLWIYCQEAWGLTFTIPEEKTRRDVKLQVWRDMLGDLDAGLVRRTIGHMEQHFAPNPGELRQAALSQRRTEAGVPSRPTADEAVGELVSLIRAHGSWHTDRALAAAERFDPALVEFITCWGGTFADGWKALCEETTDPPGSTFRAQVRDAYNLAAERLNEGEKVLAPILAEYNERMRELRAHVEELEP